jgi:signal transduction histidine kinase
MAPAPDDDASPPASGPRVDITDVDITDAAAGRPESTPPESLELPHTSSTQLRGLLDAIVAVGSELSLPVVLRRITEAAAELVDATYGALGVLDDDNESLSEFISVGLDDDAIGTIGHPPAGHGVLGLLIVEPKPLRLPDLARHPDSYGFPPGHPPMKSFLGVPIRIRGAMFGNLYLTDKRNGDEFTEADEELAVALAAAAAATIESTRLQGRLADLLVVEDRERIARELHDTVIQRLFATGLSLAGIAGRVDDPDMASRIEGAVDDLDDTVRQIRSTIFELQRPDTDARSVRRELLDLAAEAGRSLGFAVGTRFNGPIDTNVVGHVAHHLVAVAREALSNTVRHSGATEVILEVDADSAWVTLRVRDNGVGPEPTTTGHGLGNMASRADELGGMFAVDGASGAGCTVQWRVPIPD